MSQPLVFMMGEFAAEFPVDRHYAKNHMWASEVGSNTFRLGFSAYAVRLLQDVYFLDLTVEPGMPVKHRQDIGSIESKKAESSLYCPLDGIVKSINPDLVSDPTAINVDKYGDGWLLEIEAADQTVLLSPTDYLKHLESAWEVAQRTIKGQVNA